MVAGTGGVVVAAAAAWGNWRCGRVVAGTGGVVVAAAAAWGDSAASNDIGAGRDRRASAGI